MKLNHVQTPNNDDKERKEDSAEQCKPDVPVNVCVTIINITLIKTDTMKDGIVQSTKRSTSIGFTQNISETDITDNLQDIFNYVQKEFT